MSMLFLPVLVLLMSQSSLARSYYQTTMVEKDAVVEEEEEGMARHSCWLAICLGPGPLGNSQRMMVTTVTKTSDCELGYLDVASEYPTELRASSPPEAQW